MHSTLWLLCQLVAEHNARTCTNSMTQLVSSSALASSSSLSSSPLLNSSSNRYTSTSTTNNNNNNATATGGGVTKKADELTSGGGGVGGSASVMQIVGGIGGFGTSGSGTGDDENTPQLNYDQFDISDLWNIYERIEAAAAKSPHRPQRQRASCDDEQRIEVDGDDIEEEEENGSDGDYRGLQVPVLILLYELVVCDETRRAQRQDVTSSSPNTASFASSLSSSSSSSCSYQRIFDALCRSVDAASAAQTAAAAAAVVDLHELVVASIGVEILKCGLATFFPSESERIDYFIRMVEANTTSLNAKSDNKDKTRDGVFHSASNRLIFESFCHLFGANKTNLIQHLAKSSSSIFERADDCTRVLALIQTIVNMIVAMHSDAAAAAASSHSHSHSHSDSSSDERSKLLAALTQLLDSIQSHVLYRVKQQLNNNKTNSSRSGEMDKRTNAELFTLSYVKLLMASSKAMIGNNSTQLARVRMMAAFLHKIMYNLTLWLTDIAPLLELARATQLAELLLDLHRLLGLHQSHVTTRHCVAAAASDDGEDGEQEDEEERLLHTWTFSSKTRSSITDLTVQYGWPLATRFLVHFEPACNLGTGNLDFGTTELVGQYFAVSQLQFEYICIYNVNGFKVRHILVHGQPRASAHVLGQAGLVDVARHARDSLRLAPPLRDPLEDLRLNSSFHLAFRLSAYGYERIDRVRLTHLFDKIGSLLGDHFARVCNTPQRVSSIVAYLDTQVQQQQQQKPQQLKRLKRGPITDLNSHMYRVLLRGSNERHHRVRLSPHLDTLDLYSENVY